MTLLDEATRNDEIVRLRVALEDAQARSLRYRNAYEDLSLRVDRLRDPESVARRFHSTYERLAPSFGYETREASRVPWRKVPLANRRLMRAVAAKVVSDALGESLA